jgi:hypothetical protein
MITVVIPTAARPAMLRTALESIAAQGAVTKISHVYVSENGGKRDSEQVCAHFPTLPITYRFREPSRTPLEHMRLLMRECLEGELIALLHDDDWWTPSHLASALAAFEAQPDASVYGSGHFVVAGESSMLNCSGNLFPWFGASFPPYAPTWELSRLNVLMAELLGTVAHYSTMVVRTGALKKSAHIYDLGNPFDNDRMLLFALSIIGPVIFDPLPGAFVRNHAVQDCYSFDDSARVRHMCETTRWMVQTSDKPWDFIAAAFQKRMALCPPEALPTLKLLAAKEWCLPEIGRNVAARSSAQT